MNIDNQKNYCADDDEYRNFSDICDFIGIDRY